MLARAEHASLRVAVTRQGKSVAAFRPMTDLEQPQQFERTGIRHALEHLWLVAKYRELQDRMGRSGEPLAVRGVEGLYALRRSQT